MHLSGITGGWEWVLIVLAVLILFGSKKIPEFAKGLGKGIKEFKHAKNDVKKDIEDAVEEKKVKSSKEISPFSLSLLTLTLKLLLIRLM